MAERGALAGLLAGEEAPESAVELDSAPAPLDPSAAAMAMHQATTDPTLATKAGAYFDRQADLVAIQTEHLHEQREVQLAHLKLKRLSERLRVGSQLFLSFAACLVVSTLFVMLHDALTSRAVVVEPFDAPPALAASGHSGKVLAGALLDQLTRMQAATQASAAKRGLADSWSDDIKVEVPETGISFGDIDRVLRRRFGHDLHIRGDLVQSEAGVQSKAGVQSEAGPLHLTVRGDGVLPKTFTGQANALDQLTELAGEYVYAQTQPALFAVYLLARGRNDEAIAFSKQAVLTAAPAERPFLYNAWAGAISATGGPPQQALELERAALALKPDYWTAYANAAIDARNLGDEEGAWRLSEAMRHAAGGRPGPAEDIAYAPWDYLTENLLAARSAAIADADLHAGLGSKIGAANAVIAALDTDLHDLKDARLRLQTFDPHDAYSAAVSHYVRGRLADAAGDAPTAAREMEAWAAANANPAVSGGDTSFPCFIAPIEETAGHPDRADAAIAAGGHFIDCARFRADILDHRGHWPQAQQAYAAAVALAPDLPSAYYSWGLALARHNDPNGAIMQFRAAHQRGPNWADPLKAWGDLLAGQQHWAAALEHYDEALRDAPAWQELQSARANAAQHR